MSVTLHLDGDDALAVSNELITFNIHDNSYCAYIKTFSEAWKHCIQKQDKVKQKCACGSYSGVCYAGVKEFVYPVCKEDKVVGFICVSGYKCADYDSYISRVSQKYSIPKENLKAAYKSLKTDIPKSMIDTLIAPLCNMLELAFIKTVTKTNEDMSIIEKVERYLKLNRTHNISSYDLCNYLSCSRSHISHQFKTQTGKSIREYLTELRLEDAKSLLKHSELTVTEIAFSVGFGSSNYFTNVFKKEMGMSPGEYRKQKRNENNI
ncbi:MAG: helix-turn-helix domain-containing protein [Clostridia bacterium]|nr:helix-turn-helix domain-containing protein [Clostridia bacterium]